MLGTKMSQIWPLYCLWVIYFYRLRPISKKSWWNPMFTHPLSLKLVPTSTLLVIWRLPALHSLFYSPHHLLAIGKMCPGPERPSAAALLPSVLSDPEAATVPLRDITWTRKPLPDPGRQVPAPRGLWDACDSGGDSSPAGPYLMYPVGARACSS